MELKLLNKAQIVAAIDLPSEPVDVPEWGGAVRVRGFTAAEFDAMSDQMRVSGDLPTNARARVCALCMVDDAGNRLFTDAEVELLAGKSHVAVQRVFDAAQRLSGIGRKAQDQLVGNSASRTGNGASSSGSPGTSGKPSLN